MLKEQSSSHSAPSSCLCPTHLAADPRAFFVVVQNQAMLNNLLVKDEAYRRSTELEAMI